MTAAGANSARPAGGAPPAQLERQLGAAGTALLTIGAVVGTGIFLTPCDVARALPHPGWIVGATVLAGLVILAGALTYAELGAAMPRAGGLYVFLAEAWGPTAGFLYGWTAFLVILTGGIAAIAVGFAQSLASFVPWLAADHVLWSVRAGGVRWVATAPAVAATAAIVVLTIVNHFGLRAGARTQAALTLTAVAAIAGLGSWTIGTAAAPAASATTSPASAVTVGGLGAALVALLWTYDGWYAATFSAGEVRNPDRNLPRGLVLGTTAVVALYAIAMTAYVRALPIAVLQESPRAAEAAALAVAGPAAARAVAAVMVVGTLGCLAATILYSSRAYVSMAEDGMFFASMARIDARFHTPHVALWAQAGWAIALVWSGTYTQLYTFVTVAVVLFHVATALAVPILRRRQPQLPRPYRVWGYPILPIAFAAACSALVVAALRAAPVESAAGLACVALGVPAARWWRRSRARSRAAESCRCAPSSPGPRRGRA